MTESPHGSASNAAGEGEAIAQRLPFRKRHPMLTVLLILAIVVPTVTGGTYAWHLNRKIDAIPRVNVDDDLANRPDPAPGKSLNILLIGSDKAEGTRSSAKKTTVAQDAQAETWPVGKYRSDTIMVAHISGDRKEVYLVSIPRDSFVLVYDDNGEPTSEAKINSAFSEYGPRGTISTVENLTGLRMDHLAIIDWEGFKDLSKAVGGVPVTIPETFYDSKQEIEWTKGKHVLKGKEALAYVRTRHGLAEGDFDRIKRQQNFMRALMGKMLDSGVTSNPIKLSNTVSALSNNLTLDSGFTNDAVRGLALSLRGVEAKDVTFMTAPKGSYDTDRVWGSIVRLDTELTAQLFEAVADDNLARFVADNPDLALGAPETVK